MSDEPTIPPSLSVFAWTDVWELRSVAACIRIAPLVDVDLNDAIQLERLADRIAALLPPPPESGK